MSALEICWFSVGFRSITGPPVVLDNRIMPEFVEDYLHIFRIFAEKNQQRPLRPSGGQLPLAASMPGEPRTELEKPAKASLDSLIQQARNRIM